MVLYEEYELITKNIKHIKNLENKLKNLEKKYIIDAPIESISNIITFEEHRNNIAKYKIEIENLKSKLKENQLTLNNYIKNLESLTLSYLFMLYENSKINYGSYVINPPKKIFDKYITTSKYNPYSK